MKKKLKPSNVKKTAGPVAPTAPSQRIVSIDVLRGFALLGILASNIQAFAMIYAVIGNPTVFGDFTGGNYVVAMLTRVLVQGKFYPLFSMLFGAGVYLMAKKIEAKGGKPEAQHLRRMIWLIAIAWLHIFLFWAGDILFIYGLSGLAAFLFRKLSPRILLIIGLILVFIPVFQSAERQASLSLKTPEQLAAISSSRRPNQEAIDKGIAYYQGNWTALMSARVKYRWSGFRQIGTLYELGMYTGWMLLGMALFKFGILTANVSKRVLWLFLILGLGIGVPFRFYHWICNSLHNWDLWFLPTPSWFIYWETILRTAVYFLIPLGYIGGIMLICRNRRLGRLTARLAAVGRMALTNYLMHSAICSFIFFGYGLGLFGKVDRMGQLLVVLLIWVFQLWFSPLWLKHFRFGPMEWLWRSLTYWKMQPMRIRTKST
ncbi:MAG: DUF418 domain-containing protein [Candidatus Aminicenantes bacterium]|jgi:uncharacterized protein